MQPASFVLVAKAEIGNLRGWGRMRLLSSYVPTFNRNMRIEGEDGSENPDLSVFTRTEHAVVSPRSIIGAKFDEHNTRSVAPSPAV